VPVGQAGDAGVGVRADPGVDVGVPADGEDDGVVPGADRDGDGVAGELEHTGVGHQGAGVVDGGRGDERVVSTPGRGRGDTERRGRDTEHTEQGGDESLEHA
jgi:hypothetical protein